MLFWRRQGLPDSFLSPAWAKFLNFPRMPLTSPSWKCFLSCLSMTVSFLDCTPLYASSMLPNCRSVIRPSTGSCRSNCREKGNSEMETTSSWKLHPRYEALKRHPKKLTLQEMLVKEKCWCAPVSAFPRIVSLNSPYVRFLGQLLGEAFVSRPPSFTPQDWADERLCGCSKQGQWLINQREVLQRSSNFTLLCSKACTSVPEREGSWMSPDFTFPKFSSSSDPSSPWILQMLLWGSCRTSRKPLGRERFSPLIHLSCSSLSPGFHCREGGKSCSPAWEGAGLEHQLSAHWIMGISSFPFPPPLWNYKHQH